MKTLEEIAARLGVADNEALAAERCGKPVSKFFRNEARRLSKGTPTYTAECRSPKEERDRRRSRRDLFRA